MKVIIFGAKGMLGTDLMEEFAGHEVTGVDRDDVDITDAEAVAELVRELAPEVTINAAAFTDVDGAESNRDAAFAVNAEGIKNIALVAKEAGATVLHYSTDYVFPGDKEEGYAEDDEPGPAVNVYGESKLAGEKALISSGAKFYLLRTAWLYGKKGKNFVETMMKLAKESDGKPIRVVNDQYGCPTYTADLARATREIIEGGNDPGIYHAINDGVTTWYDFAVEIFYQAHMDVTVEPVSSSQYVRPAKRPRFGILKNTKTPPLRSWQDALRGYLEIKL